MKWSALLAVLAATTGAPVAAEGDSLAAPTYALDRLGPGWSLTGYYRMFALDRRLEEPFKVLAENAFANTPPHVMGVGDIYRDPPLLLLQTAMRPGGGASLAMDLALYSHFTGSNGQVPFNLNLGVNLYGTVPLRAFTLGVQAGGIHWTELSGMTFSAFPGYERYSLFERWPWEGATTSVERATTFFETGTINRDVRWARQAFKGAVVDITRLPAGLEGRVLWGKTPATAVFGDPTERYTAGGRLRWKPRAAGMVGVNSIVHDFGPDAEGLPTRLVLSTLDGSWSHEVWSGAAEAGKGSGPDGEGWAFRSSVKRAGKYVPWEVDVYRIDPEFINPFANFASPGVAAPGTDAAAVAGGGATGFGGSLQDVGHAASNRWGLQANAWLRPAKVLRFNVGWSSSRELEILTNRIAVGHKINGLPMSRFVAFASSVGPYRRWNSFYRGVSEDLFITDVDGETGLPRTQTGFSTLQLHATARFAEKTDRPIVLNGVATWAAAADRRIWLPGRGGDYYVSAAYVEVDAFVRLTRAIDASFTLGRERIEGGDATANLLYLKPSGETAGVRVEPGTPFAATGLAGSALPGASWAGGAFAAEGPVLQRSTHLGVGLDLKVSATSGLYLRHRRFAQTDDHFTADRIRGTETTVEFKFFF